MAASPDTVTLSESFVPFGRLRSLIIFHLPAVTSPLTDAEHSLPSAGTGTSAAPAMSSAAMTNEGGRICFAVLDTVAIHLNPGHDLSKQRSHAFPRSVIYSVCHLSSTIDQALLLGCAFWMPYSRIPQPLQPGPPPKLPRYLQAEPRCRAR